MTEETSGTDAGQPSVLVAPLERPKADLLLALFAQIESQVQFGDSKASFLVAGNAILLAVDGGLFQLISGLAQGAVLCRMRRSYLIVSFWMR